MQFTINQTDFYKSWLNSLKDKSAKARILIRINRAKYGNFGDHKALGAGVYEMRIDVGKGYRVYFAQQDKTIYLLISGGNKATQSNDIKIAKHLWNEIQRGHYVQEN